MMSNILGLKKIGLMLSVVFGVLLLSSCGIVTSMHTKPVASETKAPSYFFVIQAKQGKIVTKNDQQYLLLEYDKDNPHHVIQFSDRPYRIVKIISEEKLKTMWKEGNDSFEKDPPNAVLSYSLKKELPDDKIDYQQAKAQIVILNGITVKDQTIEFPVSISDAEEKSIGKLKVPREMFDVVLTIDTQQCEDMPGMECNTDYDELLPKPREL